MQEVQSRAVTPPPQPRELQSSIAALPSREQQSPISFQTILQATAHELQKSVRVLPLHKQIGIRGVHFVGLASDNGIREEDFRKNFPHLALTRLPSFEAHEQDAFVDAKSKAISAARIQKEQIKRLSLPARLRRENWLATPITGLDAVNAIPTITPNGKIEFVRVGKPERELNGSELELIQTRFGQLAQMAQENGFPSIPYIIEMATYIHYPRRKDGKKDAYSVRQMVVMLNTEKLAYLATPEGFEEYLAAASESYPPIQKTAGGMKIEAFAKLEVVDYITANAEELMTMQFDKTDQEKALKKAGILAAGKLDLRLQSEYIAKFRPTLRERWESLWHPRVISPTS